MRSWWSSVLRSKKKNCLKLAYSFDITILFGSLFCMNLEQVLPTLHNPVIRAPL